MIITLTIRITAISVLAITTMMMIISNGNRTEWSTIQVVIGPVILNQRSTRLIRNYEHVYPRIV